MAAKAPPSPATNSRPCQRCERRQEFHITSISRAGELSELHLCDACARQELTQPLPPAESRPPRDEDVEVEVERVIISEVHHEQAITLRETAGERRLIVLIGVFEATAIDRILKGFQAPRPLTHDGWLATIDSLGVALNSVCLHDYEDRIYFSELRLSAGDSQQRVDVRPSDAIALALKSGCPIRVADRLFSLASNSFGNPA